MSAFQLLPPDHRRLATIEAIKALYSSGGHFGVAAKTRNAAINDLLKRRGQSEVSDSTIRRALRDLSEQK